MSDEKLEEKLEDRGDVITDEKQLEELKKEDEELKKKDDEVNKEEEKKALEKVVPYERFNAVVKDSESNRKELLELKQKIAEMERAKNTVTEEEIANYVVSKRAEVEKLREEGKTNEASAVERDIVKIQNKYSSDIAERKAGEIVAKTLEKMEIDRAVESIVAKYPQLDESSTEFDRDKLDFVIFKRDRLVSQGMPLATAIVKASNEVMGKQDKKEDERTNNALKRAKETDDKQSKGGGSTEEYKKVSVDKMSDKEFKKLTEEELAVLRGDTV